MPQTLANTIAAASTNIRVEATNLFMFLYISVVMTVVVLAIAAVYIGPFAILGGLIYILFLPFQAFIGKTAGGLRRKGIKATDKRVRMMSEILNCMKLIKMYVEYIWNFALHRIYSRSQVRIRMAPAWMVTLRSNEICDTCYALSSTFCFLCLRRWFPEHPDRLGYLSLSNSTPQQNHRSRPPMTRRVRMLADNCLFSFRYSWERAFAAAIQTIRKRERDILAKAAYAQSLLVASVPVAPILAGVITFVATAQTAAPGSSPLRAPTVFSVMAMFNLMRFTLATVPRGVRSGTEALVGLKRLKEFLLLENRPPPFPVPKSEDVAIEVRSATFAWSSVINRSDQKKVARTPSKASRRESKRRATDAGRKRNVSLAPGESHTHVLEDVIVLRGVSLTVKTGQLVGICGGVGAGKSSFLSGVLGQMKVMAGDVFCRNSIAYVSQQAWIQCQSLRDNILFGAWAKGSASWPIKCRTYSPLFFGLLMVGRRAAYLYHRPVASSRPPIYLTPLHHHGYLTHHTLHGRPQASRLTPCATRRR